MRKFLALALGATALLSVASTALGDEVETPLLQTELAGTDGMVANMAVIEAGPGFETERHIHPGHVFLYVIEGAVEIELEGQDPVTVKAGEAAYETPNVPMIGRNISATEGAKILVLQVGKAGEPLEIPAPQ